MTNRQRTRVSRPPKPSQSSATDTEGRAKLPALELLIDECDLLGLPVMTPLRAA